MGVEVSERLNIIFLCSFQMGEMRGEMNAEAVSPEILLITVLFFCGIGLSLGAAALGISELAVLGTFVFFFSVILRHSILEKSVK